MMRNNTEVSLKHRPSSAFSCQANAVCSFLWVNGDFFVPSGPLLVCFFHCSFHPLQLQFSVNYMQDCFFSLNLAFVFNEAVIQGLIFGTRH
jgi:hypothetical protein